MNFRLKGKFLAVFILTLALTMMLSASVFAAEINIGSKDDYVANKIINEATTLKLTSDVVLEELDFNNSRLEVNADLIIDLNGHTLTIPGSSSMYLEYFGNHTVTIKDSSPAMSGMIIRASDNNGIQIYTEDDTTPTDITLNIEGIRYKSAYDSGVEIYDFVGGEGQSVNVNIKDSTFEIGYTFYYGYSAVDNVHSSTLNLDIKNSIIKSKRDNKYIYVLSEYEKVRTFADIMVEGTDEDGYEAYGYGTYGGGNKLPDNQVVGSQGYVKVEIKKSRRFDVEVSTFTPQGEGYASIAPQDITITAIGANREVDSITLNSDAEFELTNVTTGLVTQDNTTTAKIKPKEGLKYGLHTAIIKVQDTAGNIFMEEVSFEVNAYGATQVVTNEADLRKFLDENSKNYPEVTTVKLGADITLDSSLTIYPLENKTLDLNGYTLTTNDNFDIAFGTDNTRGYTTAAFNVIDSSEHKSGVITTTIDTGWSLFNIMERYGGNDADKLTYNFNVDGGTYNSPDSRAGIFNFDITSDWPVNPENRFNVNISNATFNTNPNWETQLMYVQGYITPNDFKINLEDIIINFRKAQSGLIQVPNDVSYTVGDIIPETQEIVYPNVVNDQVVGNRTALRTDLASDIQLPYINDSVPTYSIKVQGIDRFDVTAPEFANATEGYGAVTALPITIEAVGGERTIQSVTVSGADFELVGASDVADVTVEAETQNATVKIKPVSGLKFGVHTATITVTDGADNEFTTEVSFNVDTYTATQVVTTVEDFLKFTGYGMLSHPEVKVVELGNDIVLETSPTLYPFGGKTLDLKGHDLTINGGLNVKYGSNSDVLEKYFTTGEFTIKDTIGGGKIINSTYISIGKEARETLHKYSFAIDGGIYETATSAGMIVLDLGTWNADDVFEFEIKNATFNDVGNRPTKSFITRGGTNVPCTTNTTFNFENVTINATFGTTAFMSGFTYSPYTVNDVIPETYRLVSPAGEVVRNTIVSNVTIEAEETIKIEKIEGFDVIAPTFDEVVYGYDAVTPKAIDITAIGSNRTIASVTVDGSEFAITPGTPGEVVQDNTNSTYSIAPVTGLSTGTHTATITVTDTEASPNAYTATVTFVVEKATPTCGAPTGLTATYGDTLANVSLSSGTGAGSWAWKEATSTKVGDVGSRTHKAVFTPTDSTNYETVEYDVTIVVSRANQEFETTAEDKTITYGETLEYPFTLSTGDGNITYSSSSDEYVEVNEDGTLTAKKATTTPITITVTASGTTNYNEATTTYTVAVTKVRLEKPYLSKTSDNYNGNWFSYITHNVDWDKMNQSGKDKARDVGTYTTTYTLKDTDNYCWTDGGTEPVVLTWSIVTASSSIKLVNETNQLIKGQSVTLSDLVKLVIPPHVTPLTFSISGEAPMGITLTGATLSAELDTTATEVKLVARYAGIDNDDDGNYEYAPSELEFTVNIIDKTSVTLSGLTYTNKTYNGTAVEPTGELAFSIAGLTMADVDVTYTGRDGTTYGPSSESPTNAGKYTVTYAIKATNATYTGSVSYDYEITKVQIAKPTAVDTTIEFDNDVNTLNVNVDTSHVEKTEGTITETYVGNYSVTYGLLDTTNYCWSGDNSITPVTITWSITPHTSTILKVSEYNYQLVKGQSVDLNTLVSLNPYAYVDDITFALVGTPTGITLGANDLLSASAGATTGEVKVKVNFAGKNLGGTEELEYAVASELELTINVVDKTPVTLSGLTYTNKTYNGTAVEPTGELAFSIAGLTMADVDVTYTGRDGTTYGPSSESPTNAGKYTVTYAIKATNATYTGSVSYDYEITKVQIAMPALEQTIFYYTGSAIDVPITNMPSSGLVTYTTTSTNDVMDDLFFKFEINDTINYEWVGGTTAEIKLFFSIKPAITTLTRNSKSNKLTQGNEVDLKTLVDLDPSRLKDEVTFTIETLPTGVTQDGTKLKATNDATLGNVIVKANFAGYNDDSDATLEYAPATELTFDVEIAKKPSGGGSGGSSKPAKEEKPEEVVEPVTPVETIELTFEDVKPNDWFYDAVKFVVANKLMNGTSDITFEPNASTTRAMIVTILYRLENEPEISANKLFDDVENDTWYTKAVAWASENGIVLGDGNGNFNPNGEVTREQLVTILYRYANYKKLDLSKGENTNILSYNDAFNIAEYAVPAFQWACGEGIVSGLEQDLLAPQGNATRAQIATIIMRFINMN